MALGEKAPDQSPIMLCRRDHRPCTRARQALVQIIALSSAASPLAHMEMQITRRALIIFAPTDVRRSKRSDTHESISAPVRGGYIFGTAERKQRLRRVDNPAISKGGGDHQLDDVKR